MTRVYRLSEVASVLGATLDLRNGQDVTVKGLASLDKAGHDSLAFLSNPRYAPLLQKTNAAAVIISPEFAQEVRIPVLVMANPYLGFAKAATLFDPEEKPSASVANSAVIHPSVRLPSTVHIGAGAVIEADVIVGEHAVIGAGCVVGQRVEIGEASVLKPRVTVYHRVRIGRRCVIHSGAVIGSDGFGNVNHQGRWIKIPQLGTVVIGDDVEIGANTTIDRGALEDTVIEEGVKLDNLIQVAHNVKIGAHTAIAAKTGIAGSTSIGKHCMIGGAVGISGHLTIGDRVMITAMSGVSKSIEAPGVYSSGVPVREQKEWARQLGYLNRFKKYVDRIVELEKEVKQLKERPQ